MVGNLLVFFFEAEVSGSRETASLDPRARPPFLGSAVSALLTGQCLV